MTKMTKNQYINQHKMEMAALKESQKTPPTDIARTAYKWEEKEIGVAMNSTPERPPMEWEEAKDFVQGVWLLEKNKYYFHSELYKDRWGGSCRFFPNPRVLIQDFQKIGESKDEFGRTLVSYTSAVGSSYLTNEEHIIKLPKWHTTKWLALHEIAHSLTKSRDKTEDAHGKSWVNCYIYLLNKYDKFDAENLTETAQKSGLI